MQLVSKFNYTVPLRLLFLSELTTGLPYTCIHSCTATLSLHKHLSGMFLVYARNLLLQNDLYKRQGTTCMCRVGRYFEVSEQNIPNFLHFLVVSFGTDRSPILIYTRKDGFNKSCLTLRALNSEHGRFNGHWTLPLFEYSFNY